MSPFGNMFYLPSCYKLFLEFCFGSKERDRIYQILKPRQPGTESKKPSNSLFFFFLKTHPLVCSVFTAVIIRAIMIRASPSLRSLPTRDGEWQLLKHLDICLNVCCLANSSSTCSPLWLPGYPSQFFQWQLKMWDVEGGDKSLAKGFLCVYLRGTFITLDGGGMCHAIFCCHHFSICTFCCSGSSQSITVSFCFPLWRGENTQKTAYQWFCLLAPPFWLCSSKRKRFFQRAERSL